MSSIDYSAALRTRDAEADALRYTVERLAALRFHPTLSGNVMAGFTALAAARKLRRTEDAGSRRLEGLWGLVLRAFMPF